MAVPAGCCGDPHRIFQVGVSLSLLQREFPESGAGRELPLGRSYGESRHRGDETRSSTEHMHGLELGFEPGPI